MENDEANASGQPTNALSIYGQADAAMDDFPVLKAFQQYIDAEQSKSRKRMIFLCMFFAVLMTILVAVFVFLLGQMNRDKQQASEQLIQFLMKEREKPPTVVQQPAPAPLPVSNPAQDAALKAMTDTLTALQNQMVEQKKAAEAQIKAAEEQAKASAEQAKASAAAAAAAAPTKAELELQRKAALEAEKIRKAQDALREEKRKLAEEKERLRQAEVERQRRRLYPDYYKQQEAPTKPAAQTPSPPAPKKEVHFTDEDIADILREVDAAKSVDEVKAPQPQPKDEAKNPKKADKKSEGKKSTDKKEKNKSKDADSPIEYFTEDEYSIPVTVNGEDAGWSVPLN